MNPSHLRSEVVCLVDAGSCRLVFDDVLDCVDIEDFVRFVRRFVGEYGLSGKKGERVTWALYFAWMDNRRVGRR